MKFSQLRQDLVSGDWILIAANRNARPHQFKNKEKRERVPAKGCPFENPEMLDHSEPLLQFFDKNGWTIKIIENKFPAFTHKDICGKVSRHGPYLVEPGIGHHDLVITRNHHKDFPDLDKRSALAVFKAFQDRYLMLLHDKCLDYVSIFHNWGPKAGASIYHPHYQCIAIPVVPPDVEHSLQGSKKFFKENRTCAHCSMIAWEQKEKKRIVFENKHAIAFAPFASRNSFEIRVFPKKHISFFENTQANDLEAVVSVLQKSLKLMKLSLKDPDYNFFVHTAPVKDKRKFAYYHWHIEILPKANIIAGFELSTGIEINPVDPDEAVKILRAG